MEKIGVFGGSFNPVHVEHIKIAKKAIEELNLDKLYVVPTLISPHKQGESIVSGLDRFNMLKIAFSSVDKVEISDFEIKNCGVSYSYITATHFKEKYPNSEVYFLMGSDMLDNFPTWKNPEVIVSKVKLTLITRGGGEHLNLSAIDKIKTLYGVDVVKLNVTGENVSSTEVRLRLNLSLPLGDIVDSKVLDYILKYNLYPKNEYFSYAINALPEKRRLHTLGVILTAKNLSKRLGIDENKAVLASLLHDVAKYKNYEDYKGFVKPKNCPKDVVHQFLGEYIIRTELNITDVDVLNAVKYHTTGRANMSLIEKIVYVADLIEPFRQYGMVKYLREVINKDFDSGFNICIKEVYEFLKQQKSDIYYLTVDALNYYC